ncbi:hypothetical protein [Pyxidicoccus caerfyrddinensis]|uniref:hypothetical protein n=1 Tax=Pyxidicoccus caerfyrddinensis TaxID=2709663 RepID=UPI0013DA4640|nr:hypothetical protein [Pyxidicoccus caerfyrddinensis]
MVRARPCLGLLAALVLAGCPRQGVVPLRPEQYPAPYEVVARLDVNGDGREDALFRNPDDCGSAGCAHLLWLSGPGGYRAALTTVASLCEVAAEKTRGYRDVRCVQPVVDEGTQLNVRAAVRYRWSGTEYVSELAHLDGAAERPACELFRARTALPLWVLPARDVSVSERTPQGWTFGPPVTPRRGALEEGETFEPGVERVDAAGERWTQVPGRGWVESKGLDCAEGGEDSAAGP